MLFDLRGARRRRFIKVIYAGLAILMGGGLVLFGIGSDTQGGLSDALFGEEQTDSDISRDTRRTIQRLEARVLATPENQAAWSQLASERFQLASQEGLDQNILAQTGQAVFTPAGKRLLRRADTAWTRYLTLDPKTPDARLAAQMTEAYGDLGLADYPKAVVAQEIVIDGNEGDSRERRSGQFARLASFAYAAKQATKGDAAARRAVALAPTGDRDQLRKDLAGVKTQLENSQAPAQAAPTG